MSEILFASPGQTIDAAILAASSGVDTGNLDERIAAIERLNPSINGKKLPWGNLSPTLSQAQTQTSKCAVPILAQ